MIVVGNCDKEEKMGFKMVTRSVMERDHDSRLRVLVKVKAAHRSHKWARSTTRARTRHPPLESALPID
jgi:hypothetical protein